MFFAGGGLRGGLRAALLLTGTVALGVALTFWASRLLSATVLKGVPSAFTLELPPFRRPRVGQVVVRSVRDRTLFVLGRAAAVAAPAGLLLWLCANVRVGGESVLSWCAGFLDPFARLLGLDGVLLTAFLLAFPANELFLPAALMLYLGIRQPGPAPRPAGGARLDGADGGVHHSVHPGPLALLHHLPHHRQGDKERQVDRPVHRPPHRGGHGPVLPDGLRRPPAGAGLILRNF